MVMDEIESNAKTKLCDLPICINICAYNLRSLKSPSTANCCRCTPMQIAHGTVLVDTALTLLARFVVSLRHRLRTGCQRYMNGLYIAPLILPKQPTGKMSIHSIIQLLLLNEKKNKSLNFWIFQMNMCTDDVIYKLNSICSLNKTRRVFNKIIFFYSISRYFPTHPELCMEWVKLDTSKEKLMLSN